MTATASGVECGGAHSFDRARHGQLTLLGARGRRFPGDSVEQVAARDRVLGHGMFDGVADAVADAVVEAVGETGRGTGRETVRGTVGGTQCGAVPPVVLDAGAGTGFYLDRVVDALRAMRPTGVPTPDDSAEPLGIGTEISVAAARRLARVDPLVAALVADTWDGLPLVDACVDVVQVVFAPRNPAEFARVLRPGGTLVVAVPGPGHLEPLRSETGMLEPAAGKAARLEADLTGWFTAGPVRVVDVTAVIPAPIAADLALMGPSGVHLDRARVEQHVGTVERRVRVHVEVRSFRRALQE
ncbi:methyltransferase type 11 [Dietzia sp. PP-33]|jgi:23S rRNA (guanine745-N1)-methyltransferase|uniref:methyltransferase type 11 n=1 Tax=Dietzia sp. PP-33 TaxID=2957500 RepID=UPI0029AAE42D|nr:methyltransferase type 11 [Dietzia sp. PP-33]MDX2355772.1 methyltransferase type 11 [Dietzia sp. PP-33]